jgi:hypothetical protein
MKNSIFLFLLSVAVLSCKDDDPKTSDCSFSEKPVSQVANPSPPKYPCDYLYAKKAGSDWKVQSESFYADDTLTIAGFGHEQSLAFRFKFTGTGVYEIRDISTRLYHSNAGYYTTVGGDVIVSNYFLSGIGSTEVTEYNESEKWIKGNFQVTVKKQYGDASLPDQIEFTNGEFSVHLPD